MRRLLVVDVCEHYASEEVITEFGCEKCGHSNTTDLASPPDVIAAFVAQAEASGKGKQQRDTIARADEYGLTGFAGGFRTCLSDLGLSALLEEQVEGTEGVPGT